jgi:hypothetical protein
MRHDRTLWVLFIASTLAGCGGYGSGGSLPVGGASVAASTSQATTTNVATTVSRSTGATSVAVGTIPTKAAPATSAVTAAGPVTDWLVDVKSVVLANCYHCHQPGGQALPQGAMFQLSSGMTNNMADYTCALGFVDNSVPSQATIVQKAMGGLQHGGGVVLAPTSAGYATLLAWVTQGAIYDRTNVPAALAVVGMSPTTSGPGSSITIAVAGIGSGTVAVDFNGTASPSPSNASINGCVAVVAVVPEGATSGDVHVAVTPASGGAATTLDAGAFTVAPWGFSAVASLSLPRGLHTATVIDANGRVLVVGGVDVESTGQTIQTESEVYDPTADTFTLASAASLGGNPGGYMMSGPNGTGFPTKRYNHSATRLADGRILVCGGFGVDQFDASGNPVAAQASGTELASAYTFDPTTNKFTAVGSLNTARSAHHAVLLDSGDVLVAGGYNGSINGGQGGTLSSAELFDPTTNKFTTIATALAIPRMRGGAASLGGTAAFVGGDALMTWSQAKLTPPAGASASSLADFYATAVDAYQEATNAFGGSLPLPVNDARTLCTLDAGVDTATGDTLLLLAGGNGGPSSQPSTFGPVSAIEEYVAAVQTWTTVTQLQVSRMAQSSAVSGGDALWVGGDNLNPDGSVAGGLSSAEYLPLGAVSTQLFQMAFTRVSAASVTLPTGAILVTGGFENSATDPWGLDGTSVQGPCELFTKP